MTRPPAPAPGPLPDDALDRLARALAELLGRDREARGGRDRLREGVGAGGEGDRWR